VINIEAVQYQSAMVQELIRNTMLPVQSVKPTKDKLTRFMPIEGKYEHGHIIHSRQLSQDFEGELLEFPDGAHDDMVDALVYSINAHDAGVVFGWL
jgi:predicted phage terminase large subunit-like protein